MYVLLTKQKRKKKKVNNLSHLFTIPNYKCKVLLLLIVHSRSLYVTGVIVYRGMTYIYIIHTSILYINFSTSSD